MFKPRFLMSEHERSLRDLRYAGIDSVRKMLQNANNRARDELWAEQLTFTRDHLHDYRMSLIAMIGALTVCVINVVIGAQQHNYWLLFAAVAVVGVIATNLGDLQYKRDIYFGSLRILKEFAPVDQTRHEADDET